MTTAGHGELDWSGTSDGPAAVRARAQMSAADRVAWLEDAMQLAAVTGVLAADRARRAQAATSWWVGQGSRRAGH